MADSQPARDGMTDRRHQREKNSPGFASSLAEGNLGRDLCVVFGILLSKNAHYGQLMAQWVKFLAMQAC